MSSKKTQDIKGIDYEISRVEEKIKEFQDYLKENTIITKVVNGQLKEAAELQQMRHKEIEIQIKMNEAVLRWLPLLKALREEDSKKANVETRGDVEVSGLYKKRLEDK